MKLIRIVLAMCVAVMVCSSFTLKKDKDKPVYAFGVAASFNDTVVYYTEIQLLDSVFLDKNGFLPDRELYAYQLKNHLEYDMKKMDYTCMIYFSENKNKLLKDANKIKAKYKKTGNIVLLPITAADFTFKKPEE